MATSVVTPAVDFSKVEAINQKRTLAFINHWVLHTVAFLNQFSAICEEKLITLEAKIRRADHTLAILEAKLSSVPDLEDVVAPALNTNNPEIQSGSNTTGGGDGDGECVEDTSVAKEETPSAPATTTADPQGQDVVDVSPPRPATKTICEDPRYAHYFKMLKMGVPDPAVRMKMSSEGVDPSLLDNPNAPAPHGASATNSSHDSDSDSSWSD